MLTHWSMTQWTRLLLLHVCACWDFTASLYRWVITPFTNPAYTKSHLVAACSIAPKKSQMIEKKIVGACTGREIAECLLAGSV